MFEFHIFLYSSKLYLDIFCPGLRMCCIWISTPRHPFRVVHSGTEWFFFVHIFFFCQTFEQSWRKSWLHSRKLSWSRFNTANQRRGFPPYSQKECLLSFLLSCLDFPTGSRPGYRSSKLQKKSEYAGGAADSSLTRIRGPDALHLCSHLILPYTVEIL